MRQRMWRSILALSIGAILAGAAMANPPAAGCGCGTDTKAPAGCGIKVWNAFRIGEGCASTVGCNSLAAQRTFMFGSCHQFFNPGHDCKVCNPNHPPRDRVPPCTYNSFLNR
ncbi:MAG: hypothetical protein U0798_16175 [Gemmataceae bacterium]